MHRLAYKRKEDSLAESVFKTRHDKFGINHDTAEGVAVKELMLKKPKTS